MKIQVRKIVEETKTAFDEVTKKHFKYTVRYENGFVEEKDVNLNDITAFTTNKKTRVIGIGKDIYLLTLKSFKEVKKELNKSGLMYKFSLEKSN